MAPLTIVYRKVSELNPAPYNPREITPAAFLGLKTSLTKFGMVDPLIVNRRTGLLVGGHQRLTAAKELGWEQVPTVEVDLTDAQEKALNITLNNHKISGVYTEALQDLLEELERDLDMDEFSELKLDELVIDDAWESGSEKVDNTEANLDGIQATIKIRCPQAIKDEVLILVKRAILETSLEGVEVV